MVNEASKIISVYAADTSGVCSALYELGGMCVIHDSSGCNSSYTTHDEPRWYDVPSLIYISGLEEYDAVLGNDEKFIKDCVETALIQKPKFIAICASPIPFMLGMDLKAMARIIEDRSKIPTLCVETNGMHSYISGASIALLEWAKRFVEDKSETINNSINILGCIPLDFPNMEMVESMVKNLEKGGINVNSVWAMGDSIGNMSKASSCSANLVVSSSGLEVAKYMEEKFNIPYIVGCPFGEELTNEIITLLKAKKTSKIERINYGGKIAIIGEAIYSTSLAKAINKDCTIFSLLSDSSSLLINGDKLVLGEEDLENCLKDYSVVIGDGIFKNLVDESKTKFINLPHYAFSGRLYKNQFPNLIGAFGDNWIKKNID